MEFLEKAKPHRESRFVIVIKREQMHEEVLGEWKCFKNWTLLMDYCYVSPIISKVQFYVC